LLVKKLNDLGPSMLKLTSRFVLQVLPYLLMAMAALVLLPGIADSLIATAVRDVSFPSHQIETMSPFGHGETTLDLIRQDHALFSPDGFLREIAKASDLEDR
jgi:hypothetical protein